MRDYARFSRLEEAAYTCIHVYCVLASVKSSDTTFMHVYIYIYIHTYTYTHMGVRQAGKPHRLSITCQNTHLCMMHE
jgi:hypothetical protein